MRAELVFGIGLKLLVIIAQSPAGLAVAAADRGASAAGPAAADSVAGSAGDSEDSGDYSP